MDLLKDIAGNPWINPLQEDLDVLEEFIGKDEVELMDSLPHSTDFLSTESVCGKYSLSCMLIVYPDLRGSDVTFCLRKYVGDVALGMTLNNRGGVKRVYTINNERVTEQEAILSLNQVTE